MVLVNASDGAGKAQELRALTSGEMKRGNQLM